MSKLYFRYGAPKGFTAIDLADKKEGYANPIRELLQNSLDASRAAKNPKCKINVYIGEIPVSKVPHIREYKKVLEKAIKLQEKNRSFNANSRRRVEKINDALGQKSVKILMFSDNGIGMSKQALDAILTGYSHKGEGDEKATGSFGVGHLSSYSLSALRYVVYATKFKASRGKAQTLFTGQPILAGHVEAGAEREHAGRIVETIPKNEKNPKFKYTSEVPDFIQPKIEMLDHGTVVVVLGLSEPWGENAEYAIASNFFHSIALGRLSVTVNQNGKQKEITRAEVAQLIEKQKEGLQARGDKILTGKTVYYAWLAVNEKGARKTITLANREKVGVYIKNENVASSAIVLVRNGMVIASHKTMQSREMQKLQKDSDFEPFIAVIDVDQQHAEKLFDLVKGAEGPFHNELRGGTLNDEEEQCLKDLFADLSEKIKKHLKKATRKSVVLPLFPVPSNKAQIDPGGYSKPGGQAEEATKEEEDVPPPPVPIPPPPPGPPGPPRPAPVVTPRSLKSKPSFRYTDEGGKFGVKIRVSPSEIDASDDVYLSIRLGEDDDKGEAKTYLDFMAVSMNGAAIHVPPDDAKRINLGSLDAAQTYEITAEVKKPEHIGEMKVALLPAFGLKRRPHQNTK